MIFRRVARPLLASIFIVGGVNALRQKEGHAEVARPFLHKAADKTVGRKTRETGPAREAGDSEAAGETGAAGQSLPGDPVTFVQVDAAVKVAAGTMLALGVVPRFSALALLTSLVPTTFAGHPFWEETDPDKRSQQFIEFLKNAGLAGGLLLAVADTGGKPSLGWRARHAAEGAGHQMQGAVGAMQRTAGTAAASTSKATGKAAAKATKASAKAGKATGMTAGVAKGKGKAAKAVSGTTKSAAKSAKRAKHATQHGMAPASHKSHKQKLPTLSH